MFAYLLSLTMTDKNEMKILNNNVIITSHKMKHKENMNQIS